MNEERYENKLTDFNGSLQENILFWEMRIQAALWGKETIEALSTDGVRQ